MSGIQLLLTVGFILIFLYYALRLRNAFIDMMATACFFALAIFFIFFPQYTNTIAAKLGVGRGADLLFYSCILLFLFVVLKLFSRIRRLENLLTQLVRQLAEGNASYLGGKD